LSTKLPRTAGVLLHPTSLPGPYGIGDVGPIAYEWVDVLAAAGQTWWQILPLGPTGYGDSPYQCFSAFAGNPYLLSPEMLRRDGLLGPLDVLTPRFAAGRVDYGSVIPFKQALLRRAWENFQASATPALRTAFEEYCGREASWLDDFSLFMALKDSYEGKSWHDWHPDLILRKPAALEKARRQLGDGMGRHRLGQFLFSRQWAALKQYAHEKKVKLIGDAPIFVSIDSSDVWANPALFKLDEERKPSVVAGVPPDYFSATGQLWGNPHYDWAAMKKTGYAWWIARFKKTLEQVDLVRLDHFRGFEASWEIPAGNETAEVGEWVPGPGAELLNALKKGLHGLPIIAEDLGVITPPVDALRRSFGLPGMLIMQFAFSGPDNRFLPHHHERNMMVYPGTHDNDTSVGWYEAAPDYEKQFMHRYLACDGGNEVAWTLIRLAWQSVAAYALVSLQDLLSLPTTSRMNYPGRPSGNWQWRFTTGEVTPELVARLGETSALYCRHRDSDQVPK
jgi:4-alpha-glucanotransferase